jgi:GxxExxY protein
MNEESKSVILDIFNEVISHTPYGLTEEIYEKAFCMECDLRDIKYHQQEKYPVWFKNRFLTQIIPDLILKLDFENPIIVEFKIATKPREKKQILKYLDATRAEELLLINFETKELIIKTKTFDEDGKPDLKDEPIERS